MATFGCVLIRGCSIADHRNFEIELFQNPRGVIDNQNDLPIRFLLSSFYHTYGTLEIPDGTDYTRTHCYIVIINAMRQWTGLSPVTGADLGIPNCS